MPTHHSDENNQARGKGEKFTVWPDPTGRLGVARLWPHLLDFLQTDGVLPANWQASMATFDEATLLLVFQVHPRIMTGNLAMPPLLAELAASDAILAIGTEFGETEMYPEPKPFTFGGPL